MRVAIWYDVIELPLLAAADHESLYACFETEDVTLFALPGTDAAWAGKAGNAIASARAKTVKMWRERTFMRFSMSYRGKRPSRLDVPHALRLRCLRVTVETKYVFGE